MKYSWGKQIGVKVRRIATSERDVYTNRRLNHNENKEHICGHTKKLKRFRSAFTTEQINFLEKEFKKYPYIGNARRKDVSNILNIPERAVKIWFQNRRMKEKKDTSSKESEGEDNRLVKIEVNGIPSIREQSVNESRSLPMLSNERSFVNEKHDIEQHHKEKQTPPNHTNRFQFYKENTNREVCQNNDQHSPTSVIKETNNLIPKPEATAEFSIKLLKKYKDECLATMMTKEDQPIKSQSSRIENIKHQHHPMYKQDYGMCSPQLPMPEDLSSQKPSPQFSKPSVLHNQRNADKNSTLPVYLKDLHQPYISPGNMIWKPINMSPVSPANPVPEMLDTFSSHPNLVRRNCNCDCHYKDYSSPIAYPSTTPVQYVLTAIPYQSSGPSFNVN